jgi:hypothetical protein
MSNNFDPPQGPPTGSAPNPGPSYPEPGYRAPPPGPWGAPATAFQAAYAPATTVPGAAHNSIYGDGAGEYLRMQRGSYSAWPHVVIAFIYQIGFMGCFVALPIVFLCGAIGLNDDTMMAIGLGTGGIGGATAGYFVFRDRWRCIEAFASRYCIGFVRISALYVPIVAFVYANVRGVQKLSGK